MNEATYLLDEEKYLKTRVDDQINWLSKKSSASQSSFKRTRLFVIILSASLPFLVGYVGMEQFTLWEGAKKIDVVKFLVGLIGVFIASMEGIQALHKHQDKWVNYIVTSESLKREKMLFLTRAGVYTDIDTPFKAFVARAEDILAGENKQWAEYMLENKQNKNQNEEIDNNRNENLQEDGETDEVV
ncbi:MAG: DUF4231 domain-containing protein [Bacteroidota bacterium]